MHHMVWIAMAPDAANSRDPPTARSGDSVFNQWGSTAYGWGIQLKLHHHYQNHKVSHTVTPFTAIRGGSYGQAPIPTFYCSKINSMYNKGKSTKPGDSFYAVQCDEITVKGGGASKTASYGDVNGIYRVANKITSLPNGGSNNYPYCESTDTSCDLFALVQRCVCVRVYVCDHAVRTCSCPSDLYGARGSVQTAVSLATPSTAEIPCSTSGAPRLTAGASSSSFTITTSALP